MRNLLRAAEMIEALHGPDAAARFGADMLGRAIGHEQRHETSAGQPATMFYSNLIHATGHTATRKVMAFTAARGVMAGR